LLHFLVLGAALFGLFSMVAKKDAEAPTKVVVSASQVVSTPEQKCIGLPEQKYISDAGKKAPEPGAFSSDIRLGSDYLPACPSWHGVSGACSD
jgi:hypothetical protein